jgi:hypothetical protein
MSAVVEDPKSLRRRRIGTRSPFLRHKRWRFPRTRQRYA